jgi:hypothetical protein
MKARAEDTCYASLFYRALAKLGKFLRVALCFMD